MFSELSEVELGHIAETAVMLRRAKNQIIFDEGHSGDFLLVLTRGRAKVVLVGDGAEEIMDNDGTHKTPLIRSWFAKRPRFQVRFPPTYGSWLNQVERWFAEVTNKQLDRGVHRSVTQLKAAIREFIAAHHARATPFAWTKSADEILASIARFAQRPSIFRPRHVLREPRGSGH